MDYTLALQLKESGFPQSTFEYAGYIDSQEKKLAYWSAVDRIDNVAYAPTLSELIEACGEEFNGLERDKDSSTGEVYWSAKAWKLDYNTNGSTPEEAVGRLYLSLHKK